MEMISTHFALQGVIRDLQVAIISSAKSKRRHFWLQWNHPGCVFLNRIPAFFIWLSCKCNTSVPYEALGCRWAFVLRIYNAGIGPALCASDRVAKRRSFRGPVGLRGGSHGCVLNRSAPYFFLYEKRITMNVPCCFLFLISTLNLSCTSKFLLTLESSKYLYLTW